MNKLLSVIFPKEFNNNFQGYKIVLYVFYVMTAITILRSLEHIFSADGGAQSIATIPLDTFPQASSAVVITMFGLWGVSQLIIGIIYLIASIKYRSMIPLLYCLMIVEYAGRMFVGSIKPIETVGTAPGSIMNIPVIILAIVMVGLSVRVKS